MPFRGGRGGGGMRGGGGRGRGGGGRGGRGGRNQFSGGDRQFSGGNQRFMGKRNTSESTPDEKPFVKKFKPGPSEFSPDKKPAFVKHQKPLQEKTQKISESEDTPQKTLVEVEKPKKIFSKEENGIEPAVVSKNLKVGKEKPAKQMFTKEEKEEHDKCTLFVKNLPKKISEQDIRSLSSEILQVRRKSFNCRFAWVSFANEKVAEKNYSKLQNAKLGGNELFVDYCGTKSSNPQVAAGLKPEVKKPEQNSKPQKAAAKKPEAAVGKPLKKVQQSDEDEDEESEDEDEDDDEEEEEDDSDEEDEGIEMQKTIARPELKKQVQNSKPQIALSKGSKPQVDQKKSVLNAKPAVAVVGKPLKAAQQAVEDDDEDEDDEDDEEEDDSDEEDEDIEEMPPLARPGAKKPMQNLKPQTAAAAGKNLKPQVDGKKQISNPKLAAKQQQAVAKTAKVQQSAGDDDDEDDDDDDEGLDDLDSDDEDLDDDDDLDDEMESEESG